jgi:hypothetical protein
MNKDIVDKVSAILTNNGIEHENTDHSVFISKSSIINKIGGEYDNDSYAQLIAILNDSFNARFRYISKTANWLQLDIQQ